VSRWLRRRKLAKTLIGCWACQENLVRAASFLVLDVVQGGVVVCVDHLLGHAGTRPGDRSGLRGEAVDETGLRSHA